MNRSLIFTGHSKDWKVCYLQLHFVKRFSNTHTLYSNGWDLSSWWIIYISSPNALSLSHTMTHFLRGYNTTKVCVCVCLCSFNHSIVLRRAFSLSTLRVRCFDYRYVPCKYNKSINQIVIYRFSNLTWDFTRWCNMFWSYHINIFLRIFPINKTTI